MASERVKRHRAAFAAMQDWDLCDTLETLSLDGMPRHSVIVAIACAVLRAETRLRVRHGAKPRILKEESR